MPCRQLGDGVDELNDNFLPANLDILVQTDKSSHDLSLIQWLLVAN